MKKSFLILLFILSFSVLANAQSWQELNEQVVALCAKGEYKKAILVGEKAIIAAKKKFGTDHPDYATSLNNLAGPYEGMGRYEKAEPLYVQAMAIRKKVLGESG